MKKPHTKARGILFAAAGMFLIPGSVSEVSAAERKDEQPFIQASGIESVLEKCYETEVKDNINLYLVPTEEGEYLNMAFSDTKEFTYIRNAPDDSGDWVGKLYKDSAAQVLEYLDGWTKIRSGSAEGYVPEDALFTGEEAQARAQEYEKDTVTVTAYVLNVREGCGTDSKILTQIKKGEVYETVGEATGGWYPVKVGDKSGWVSGDYVIAETSYSYGETKEEEEKRIAEEEAQEKMAASVVCGADGRPGTRPVGAVSQGRVNTPSQAPGTPGQAVIDYACQFIGNPYVWGGTSLTNGADCSGFVQSVYKNFGYSLPRTCTPQSNAGTAVSLAALAPGDLVFYDHGTGSCEHVGIYIGNGQIVHASSSRTGIKISNVNYSTPFKACRIVN